MGIFTWGQWVERYPWSVNNPEFPLLERKSPGLPLGLELGPTWDSPMGGPSYYGPWNLRDDEKALVTVHEGSPIADFILDKEQRGEFVFEELPSKEEAGSRRAYRDPTFTCRCYPERPVIYPLTQRDASWPYNPYDGHIIAYKRWLHETTEVVCGMPFYKRCREELFQFVKSLRGWNAVRDLCAVRPIAIYWQGETQRRLCAPGKRGREDDRAAYEADSF